MCFLVNDKVEQNNCNLYIFINGLVPVVEVCVTV